MMAGTGMFHGLAATLALVTAPALSQSAEPRAPTGKWVVDFADSRCTATRDYGSVEKPLFLLLKPAPIGDVVQVAVIRNSTSGETMQVDAKLSINQGTAIDTSLLAFSANKQKRRINLINLPLDMFDRVRRASSVSISARGEVRESFALTDMAPLMKAMDACLADLQRVWNIGASHSERIKVPAKPKAPLMSYFSTSDYPDVAVWGDLSGTVQFALLIDETGKVADCTVTSTSGVASLDGQTCAILLTRGKFSPAIGTDGKPIKSSMVQRIRWEMP